MVYRHACERTIRTTRKRKLGSGRRFQAATTRCNPLALLRTIVMVTTLFYHSMSNTGRRTTSTILVNAWSATKVQTNSLRTRGIHLHTRRRIIPSSSIVQTILHQPSCISNPQYAKNYHRLFSSTTSVDESSKDTNTDSANLPTQQDEEWKNSPLVNPTINFETLLVPNAQLTKWITHPGIQHRLAKPDNWEFLKHVHPRIKLVQDYNENKQYKQLPRILDRLCLFN